jgi:acyl carrier protein
VFRVSDPIVSGSAPGAPAALDALESELAVLFVEALNLDVKPADIDPAAPLYGDGLGLDSIDILEVALEVSRRYGFQLRSDDENNQRIFQSLRSLAAHVAQHRTQ